MAKKKESFLTKICSEEQDFEHMRPFLEYGKEFILWVVKNMEHLRRNATNSEISVGKYMYNRRIIFISQAPFVFRVDGKPKCYFADYYIPATNVIIEIDGRSHDKPESIEYDRRRDKLFLNAGIQTIRIRSNLVFQDKYRHMIPIPAEGFLRKEKIRVIPEGVTAQKERMLREALKNRKRK